MLNHGGVSQDRPKPKRANIFQHGHGPPKTDHGVFPTGDQVVHFRFKDKATKAQSPQLLSGPSRYRAQTPVILAKRKNPKESWKLLPIRRLLTQTFKYIYRYIYSTATCQTNPRTGQLTVPRIASVTIDNTRTLLHIWLVVSTRTIRVSGVQSSQVKVQHKHDHTLWIHITSEKVIGDTFL